MRAIFSSSSSLSLPLRPLSSSSIPSFFSSSVLSRYHSSSSKNNSPSFTPSNRIKSFGASVFTEFTALSNQHQSVNLGQGFPDFTTEDFVKECAQRAIRGGSSTNQYTRSAGYIPLVQTLSAHYSPKLQRKLDPLTNFVVTAGATEAGMAAAQAIFNEGDEAILFEPFYDMYPAQILMNGAKPVFVPMRLKGPPTDHPNGARYHSNQLTLDLAEFEAAITEKTKAIYLTNPHNPYGKIFTREELSGIAEILNKKKHQKILVISDEVYDELLFDNTELVRFSTLQGMWDRTITLGSAGKTFSVTGWKIGWAMGPPHLMDAVFKSHQFITFCVATPLQDAVVYMFEEANRTDYFSSLRSTFQRRRDALVEGLASCNMTPVIPSGGYFVMAGDTSSIKLPWDAGHKTTQDETRDFHFARWLTKNHKVTPIPPSAFYCVDHSALAKNSARFAFCKKDETIIEGCNRLKALADQLKEQNNKK